MVKNKLTAADKERICQEIRMAVRKRYEQDVKKLNKKDKPINYKFHRINPKDLEKLDDRKKKVLAKKVTLPWYRRMINWLSS